MRRFFGRILGDRRVAGGLFLILELIAVMWGVGWMSERWPSVTPALTILSFVIVVWLVRKYDNPTYKITWIIIILLFPLFGGLFYLFWGNTPFNRARTQHQYEPNPPDFTDYMRKPATEELSQLHPRHAARTRYIDSLCGMPAWTNTEAHYFRAGEDMFASMCEELEKAERFIFLEYFIIEEGRMWNTILDILARKAKEGLDVRIIYDDVGSIATLPQHYDRYLVSLGIRAVRFNRFIPTLNTYLNYRNHRKMMIIDGNVGYMGGINLADEYINDFVEHGVHNVLLAERDLLAGHRHVERFGAELCLLQTRGERALAAFDLVFQLAADLVRKLADHGTLLGGELAHLFQNGGQLTLFAEIPDAQRFERIHVHGFFDRLAGRFPQAFQHFLHGFLLYESKYLTDKKINLSSHKRDERHASAVPPTFGAFEKLRSRAL